MELFEKNWDWISSNPWGFLALSVAIFALGWQVAKLYYGERIELLKIKRDQGKGNEAPGGSKFLDKFLSVIRFGGKNQKQVINGSQNVVASQSRGGPATSVIQAQVVVERHGYARTPTELFSDFDHAIRNYHGYGGVDPINPPALLVSDWDVMIIQMLFRDNDPLKDNIAIVSNVIAYKGIPLKHPVAGVLRMTPSPDHNP